MFDFLQTNGISVLEKAHTHNMLSHKVNVVCLPFGICCYNYGRASGVKMKVASFRRRFCRL